ncbi:universal stress protein, partial [Actinomadura bangladeshensis]
MSDVVVGYDGSGESELALRWAVEEALLRRLPLTVCHAWRWPYPISHIDYEGVAIVRRMGEHLLDHGVAVARELAPGVAVRGRLRDGSAAPALLGVAGDAEVIVVGSRGAEEMPVGSVALRVPARADRPVVVVRSAAPRDGLVVVGVDGSSGGDAALG